MRSLALSLLGLLAALLMTDPDQSGCGAPFADARGCGESAIHGPAPDGSAPNGLGAGGYTIESESLNGSSPSHFGEGAASGNQTPASGTRLDFDAGQPAFDLETLGGFGNPQRRGAGPR